MSERPRGAILGAGFGGPFAAEVVLVEAGPRVLAAFETASSDRALRAVERKGLLDLTGGLGLAEDHRRRERERHGRLRRRTGGRRGRERGAERQITSSSCAGIARTVGPVRGRCGVAQASRRATPMNAVFPKAVRTGTAPLPYREHDVRRPSSAPAEANANRLPDA